jgi:hypothetical protein
LSNSLNQVGNQNREIYFAGVLTKAGSYVISPELLEDMIAENRSRQVWGEVHFFYEALRFDNNANGTMLKEGPYSYEAILPYRKGEVFRPEGEIVNEDSSIVNLTGNWEDYPQRGFEGMVYRTDETQTIQLWIIVSM